MAAKGNRHQIVMNSTESGHQYHTTKNKINTTDKLEIKKFDPLVRKHVLYKEKK